MRAAGGLAYRIASRTASENTLGFDRAGENAPFVIAHVQDRYASRFPIWCMATLASPSSGPDDGVLRAVERVAVGESWAAQVAVRAGAAIAHRVAAPVDWSAKKRRKQPTVGVVFPPLSVVVRQTSVLLTSDSTPLLWSERNVIAYLSIIFSIKIGGPQTQYHES